MRRKPRELADICGESSLNPEVFKYTNSSLSDSLIILYKMWPMFHLLCKYRRKFRPFCDILLYIVS